MPASNWEQLRRRKFLALTGTAVSGVAVPRSVGKSTSASASSRIGTQSTERTEVEVISVSDGDTVDVRFDDGAEETIRVIGVDTPEKKQFARFERPEEWEGFAYDPTWSTLERITFSSACSLFAADGTTLTADEQVAVWASESAETESTDNDDPIVDYGEETPIPLVAVDGSVVGFGAVLAEDEGRFEEDQEEFLINVWNHYIGDGTVLWDEGHDQFYTLDKFKQFVDLARKNNYTIESTANLTEQLDAADGAVITSPSAGFSASEIDALQSFLADGGALFVHSQSDFQNFDETANLNDLARGLDLSFRFNDDQVVDSFRNEGQEFESWTERFNESTYPSFFLDRAGIDGGATTRTTAYLTEHAKTATEFAREQLAGETIDITHDPNEPLRGSFDRLLAYIWYDATGDGNRETLYNRQLVEEGYARAYSSGISRFHEFRAAEEQARNAGTGVWAQSDISTAPSYRNRPVEAVFAPQPASIQTASGQLPLERAPVQTEASATQVDASVTYDETIPLVGVDPQARTAVTGAPLIEEQYEQTEGFAVDTSIYENFVLVTNLITALTDRDGWILIDGGHGQFGADYAQSEEDAAYFQRYLEGQQIRFEQLNDVSGEYLTGRALIVTTPADPYSEGELAALQSFRDAGGAVVLMGSAAAPTSARQNLNEIAAALGTDLRVGSGAVTDDTNSRNDDPALLETSALNSDFASLLLPYDGTATVPESANRDTESATPTPVEAEGSSSTSTETATSTATTTPKSTTTDTVTQAGTTKNSSDDSSLMIGVGATVTTAILGAAGWLKFRDKDTTAEDETDSTREDESSESNDPFNSPEAEEWFGSNEDK